MSFSTGTLPSSPGGLFSRYTPRPDVYDEMVTAVGQFRAPWSSFVGGLDSFGTQGLQQRWEQVRRLLRENGVSYNVYGAPQGPSRPWELDPIPLLVDEVQWQSLTQSLGQRARLLNAILADLYGPQQLLQRGLLPPELVFGHPGFLLPCHGIAAPQNLYLHLYAGHLARGGDGRWIVLGDRTQGPAGAGFALENRIVLSRVLPDEFHRLHVQRLAGFFITLRETLQALAAARGDNPRVVLLSPGPHSATFFEDTYLARYLGYTLVEGGDLTVRGLDVCLKTLGGLLPVDIILRRLPDEDCDPLELRADSLHGVPGLVQAVRSGSVVVANALGSGFLEAPALMAFLPGICRQLFGEELQLPSVPTWWCGRDEDWRYVQAHFDDMVVRPAIAHRSRAPIAVAQLPQREREELREMIRARRSDFVAQAYVVRSTTPVWQNGSLQPWHLGLRAFAVADRNGNYQVMPGGLSRATPNTSTLSDLMTAGHLSKDVWVLSDKPVPPVSLLRGPTAAVELRRSGNDLPSRVADNLFWLGRYMERAEGMVRQLRSVVVRMTSELESSGLPELTLLVQALSENGRRPEPVGADLSDSLELLRAEIISFVFHPSRSGAFYETLHSLHHTASIVRDRISVDTWRIVNQVDLDLLFPWPKTQARLGDVLLLLNQVLNLLVALSGLGTESMTRGPGWRFMDMGRRLERALHILRLLRKTLVYPLAETTPLLEALLEIADSSMTYRYRYLTSLQLAPVLDLLLIDETNPRSVGFQLIALSDHVRHLPSQDSDPLWNEESRITLTTQGMLRTTDVESLAQPDEHGVRAWLDTLLDQASIQLWQLSHGITHTYFTHTGPSRQLGSIPPSNRA
jgi:uncharacterized circularly permuted ATP-grasp superfamily protein/uncharacterized alpha-E superfamily protein